jgi:hypothetical protein
MTALTQALRRARQAALEIAEDAQADCMSIPTPNLAWLFWRDRSDAAILQGLHGWEHARVRKHFQQVFFRAVSK